MAGDSVQQIKERLTIVDVVSPYVELHKAGKNYKGKSPFTNEKTPSFYVSPDRGMYYCFSSSQGGDIFTFIQEMEGVDFRGALKMLAEKAGVELVPEDPKKKGERERQYDLLSEAAGFFESALSKKPAALAYLKNRGVKEETITKWRIGYAPGPPEHGWREAKDYLEGKSYSKKELLKTGLIKGMDTGKEPYDVFRDRVMFPIFDVGSRVVAFSGRILSKDTEAPKYVNSPETEFFNKSEILYGYDKAKQGIRHHDFSLIVEGQFDVVMTHQAGYHNAVAVSGTALTAHHIMLLQRLSDRVVLALDSDRAGIAAVKRAADLMLARGMDVKVVNLPEGKDPADIIVEDKTAFKKMVGSATHVIEYLLAILKKDSKDDRTFKLKVRDEVLPYVAKIPNYIDQEHFEGIVAEIIGSTKEAVHVEVSRIKEKAEPVLVIKNEKDSKEIKGTKEEYNTDRKDNLLRHLLGLVTVLPHKLADIVSEAISDITGTEVSLLIKNIDPAVLSKISFELESDLVSMPEKQLKEDLVHKLSDLRRLMIRDRLRTLRESFQSLEAEKSDFSDDSLLQEISDEQKAMGTDIYSLDMFDFASGED